MNQSVSKMSGHVYARHPRHHQSTLSTSERALLAAELVTTGKVPSIVEASVMCHVSVGYTHTAVHTTDFDRARIARGELTLSQLHNYARQPMAAE